MKKKAVPELKPLPRLLSDEAAEQFVEASDLSEYDLSSFKPMRFERWSASTETTISETTRDDPQPSN